MTKLARHTVLAILLGLLAAGACQAQSGGRFEVGARAGIAVSGGEPANDITYAGVVLKYALSPGALVGVSVDRLEYDFERPWALVGLRQDLVLAPDVIDAKATSTLVRGFYERSHALRGDRWHWYWNVGLGFARPDVPTVSGPVEGGGTFTIVTDAGTEWIPSVGVGVRYSVTRSVGIELGATLDYHRAEWEVTDTVSGRTATVKSYSSGGLQAGVSVRF